MVTDAIKNKFKGTFNDLVSFDELLAPYTTFKCGGPADILVRAKDTTTAKEVFKLSKELGLNLFVLGGGSNILVGDKGYRGVVLKNELKGTVIDGNTVSVKSGTDLEELLNSCAENGLSGLEFMSGIYGTVGGAVAGNAGAYGKSIGELVESIKILDAHASEKVVNRRDLNFSYRKTSVEGEDLCSVLITSCKISLKPGNRKDIKKEMADIILEREGKMIRPIPSAGCFFKNVESKIHPNGKLSAGKLLDESGAKSMGNERVGVHNMHANIVMNKGKASSKDILDFVEKLKRKVKEDRGFELEYEIKLVGEF